jgi:AraC family transcriptional regulator
MSLLSGVSARCGQDPLSHERRAGENFLNAIGHCTVSSITGCRQPARQHDVNSPHGFRQRALLRAHSYMENHIGENVSLGDLAEAACVSRFHFARLFRVSTGNSPMAFLLRLRVERAKEMLRRGDAKIAEIAAALGFFDQSHFARSFRRVVGVSPREFMHNQADARRHCAQQLQPPRDGDEARDDERRGPHF